MRAAPPLVVNVTRFGAWRGFTACLCAVTAAVVVAWVVLRLQWERPFWPALAAAVLAAGLSLVCSRRESLELRWDGQTWEALGAGLPAVRGRVQVMVDLQDALLLRLTGDGPPRRDVVWLPVQRRGLEASWHALRAAVYSPTHDRRRDAGPLND